MKRKDIYRQVLERVSPTREQRERLESAATELLRRSREWLRGKGVDAEVVQVGSAARGTWLANAKDIDVFVVHPAGTPTAALERTVEALARHLAGGYQKRYAQHPYVTFEYRGFDVDLVPCYPYDPASGIRSAVDRTPAHNAYVISHLAGREPQVLLLKQFLSARGIYGAELRTQGFSGYLCELLVLAYGSFDSLVDAARGWRYGVTLDPAGHPGHAAFDDPLVVIDPTDPGRNVAAALSVENMFRFVEACREFHDAPGLDAFFPPSRPPMRASEFRALVRRRGLRLVGVVFRAPPVVEDVLYPQLRRSLAGAQALLERGEFRVHRAGAFADGGDALLLFELSVWRLPPTRRQVGPPVEEEEHVKRFRVKHPRAYVEGARYVADEPREHQSAAELLRAELPSAAHGTQVRESLAQGFEVVSDAELWSARGGAMRPHLAEFFQPFRG